jgi:cytochrome b involved in lipid metabolism
MQPAPSTSTLAPSSQSKKSRAIILPPGYSPLDWAALTKSPSSAAKLRGHDAPANARLLRVSPTQLKKQNGRKGRDAWTSYQGRVYNVTPYLPFHPGGQGELMRGVGRDGGQLFMEVHPWVNWEGMLAECMVGVMVGDGEGDEEANGRLVEQEEVNELEEMD